MEFSVVVPVYDEDQSLVLFQNELHKVMEQAQGDYEIIYIDDGSRDRSLEVLKHLKHEYPKMRILSFAGHAGKSAALVAGFRAARGTWIITLDSDLQNPPSEIMKLLAVKGKADLVMGVRKDRQDTFLRRFSSGTAHFFRRLLLGDTTRDTGSGLRMFKKEITQRICLFRNFHRFLSYLAREQGFAVKEVDIAHDRRRFGKAKYGTLKRAWEGLFDLVGVLWLTKRSIRYEVKHEY